MTLLIILIVLAVVLAVLLVLGMCKAAKLADESSERIYQSLTKKVDEHHAAARDVAEKAMQPRRRGLRVSQS